MRIPRRLTRARVVVVVLVAALVVAAVARLVPADVAAVGVIGLPMLAGLYELNRAHGRLRAQSRATAERNRAALAERAEILAQFRAVADRLESVEQTQRRLLAAVETERLAGADRHHRCTETMTRLHHEQTRQIESLFRLSGDLTVGGGDRGRP